MFVFLAVLCVCFSVHVQLFECIKQESLHPVPSAEVNHDPGKPHTWIHKVDIFKWNDMEGKQSETHGGDHHRRENKQRNMKSNDVYQALLSLNSTQNPQDMRSLSHSGKQRTQETGESVTSNLLASNHKQNKLFQYLRSPFQDIQPTTPASNLKNKGKGTSPRNSSTMSKNRLKKSRKQRKNSRNSKKSSSRFPGKGLRSQIRSESKTAWLKRTKSKRHRYSLPWLQHRDASHFNKILLVSPIFAFKLGNPFGTYGETLKTTMPDALIVQRRGPYLNLEQSIPIYRPICLSRSFFSNMGRNQGIASPFNLLIEMNRFRNHLFGQPSFHTRNLYSGLNHDQPFPRIFTLKGQRFPGKSHEISGWEMLVDDNPSFGISKSTQDAKSIVDGHEEYVNNETTTGMPKTEMVTKDLVYQNSTTGSAPIPTSLPDGGSGLPVTEEIVVNQEIHRNGLSSSNDVPPEANTIVSFETGSIPNLETAQVTFETPNSTAETKTVNLNFKDRSDISDDILSLHKIFI